MKPKECLRCLMKKFQQWLQLNQRVTTLEAEVRALSNLMNPLATKVQAMANTLQDVLDLVGQEKTVADGLVALTASLKAQLDAITSGSLTPAQQAQVDAIFAAVSANKQELADATVANTPAAPPATP